MLQKLTEDQSRKSRLTSLANPSVLTRPSTSKVTTRGAQILQNKSQSQLRNQATPTDSRSSENRRFQKSQTTANSRQPKQTSQRTFNNHVRTAVARVPQAQTSSTVSRFEEIGDKQRMTEKSPVEAQRKTPKALQNLRPKSAAMGSNSYNRPVSPLNAARQTEVTGQTQVTEQDEGPPRAQDVTSRLFQPTKSSINKQEAKRQIKPQKRFSYEKRKVQTPSAEHKLQRQNSQIGQKQQNVVQRRTQATPEPKPEQNPKEKQAVSQKEVQAKQEEPKIDEKLLKVPPPMILQNKTAADQTNQHQRHTPLNHQQKQAKPQSSMAFDMSSLQQSKSLLKQLEERDAAMHKKQREQEKIARLQPLGPLLMGYKTRRILKEHQVVAKLRIEYSDLLQFAFGLQIELKQLNPASQRAQIQSTKQLLIQSVKDLNQKRQQFNATFYQVLSSGRQWLLQSRPEDYDERISKSVSVQFEARLEEQLEREAQYFGMPKQSHYSTASHARTGSNMTDTSCQLARNESKKAFLKRKKVYDPKEAIKQQKQKQTHDKENNTQETEKKVDVTGQVLMLQAISECTIKQTNTQPKTPEVASIKSKSLNPTLKPEYQKQVDNFKQSGIPRPTQMRSQRSLFRKQKPAAETYIPTQTQADKNNHTNEKEAPEPENLVVAQERVNKESLCDIIAGDSHRQLFTYEQQNSSNSSSQILPCFSSTTTQIKHRHQKLVQLNPQKTHETITAISDMLNSLNQKQLLDNGHTPSSCTSNSNMTSFTFQEHSRHNIK